MAKNKDANAEETTETTESPDSELDNEQKALSRSVAESMMQFGSIDPLAADGFIEDTVIKVGDPTNGNNVGMYVGHLIGPGADVELADGDGTMPTWQCHPLARQPDGTIKPVTNVIHSIICSNQLDAGFKRAQAASMASGKDVQVGAEFIGQGKNRRGLPLNKFRVAWRLVPKLA